MADWAKIILKTGLVAGIMVGIWAVFTQVPIPNISYDVAQTFEFGKAFLVYWCPAFSYVWTASVALIAIFIALWSFRLGSIAIRWLFKVNE